MRILHTADWHMNNTLGRVDISSHIIDALQQIAGLLEEHAVDVMVVAGDLFSERSRPAQMGTAVGEIRRLFLPFLERGGTIVAIAGNHDSEVFFGTLRDALKLGAPGGDGRGRLHLTATPEYLRLHDRTGLEVQFALMPYPTPRCYLRGETSTFNSIEAKHRLVLDGFKQMLKTLQEQKIDPRLPAVLVSHVHVRGAQSHTLYKLSETDDIMFEPGDISAEWAYVAYGHIHKPGPAVPRAAHIRYSGSVARLDAAERDDEKSVVLVDVGPSGRVGEPVVLPLRSLPFYQIEIHDPETEIPLLRERYPEAERALVYYTLHWRPDRHNLSALQSDIEKVFPSWYGRNLVKEQAGIRLTTGPGEAGGNGTQPAGHDVSGIVRGYLENRFQDHAERESLLALADALLAQEARPGGS